MYGKKYSFRNPIKQNYGHIYALRDLLDLPTNHFISVVVFSSDAKLKVQTTRPVIYMKHLRKTIRLYKEKRIDASLLDRIENTIRTGRIDSKDNRSEHIKRMQRDNKKKIKEGVCPRCGGKLIRRKGKYGKFFG